MVVVYTRGRRAPDLDVGGGGGARLSLPTPQHGINHSFDEGLVL